MSETISVQLVHIKTEQSALPPLQTLRADRLERASRCSSESNRSHQMLHLPEEQNHSDEMEVKGEAMEKQLSPKREFKADLAPRPLNPAPRPVG